MNQVKLMFFATFRTQVGVREDQIDLPDGARIKDLKRYILQSYPNLEKSIDTALFSINREFAFDEDVIPPMAEVALFPPVSGGSDYPTILAITDEQLDLNELLARITFPETGAACIFSGMVREVTKRDNPHETAYLEYEAYHQMAEEKLAQVASEIRQRWPSVLGIAIVQRIGRLEPGTPTILIACSSAHRDTGVFEAARYGIDRLKEIVPIWKKEVGVEGELWVEGSYIPTRDD